MPRRDTILKTSIFLFIFCPIISSWHVFLANSHLMRHSFRHFSVSILQKTFSLPRWQSYPAFMLGRRLSTLLELTGHSTWHEVVDWRNSLKWTSKSRTQLPSSLSITKAQVHNVMVSVEHERVRAIGLKSQKLRNFNEECTRALVWGKSLLCITTDNPMDAESDSSSQC